MKYSFQVSNEAISVKLVEIEFYLIMRDLNWGGIFLAISLIILKLMVSFCVVGQSQRVTMAQTNNDQT